jgi:trk system potassium uptake protein TrkA
MKAIVIGCGRVGSGLARALTLAHHDVTVVDIDPAALERLGPAFPGTKLVGVGFDRDVLVEAGIETCDAVAAVTGSDEANAVAARAASRLFRVPRVVARLYDQRQADIYQRLGVQVVAPVEWAIERLAELLTFRNVGAATSLGGGQVDLVDAELPPLLDGRRTREVTAPGEVMPVAITRAGETFIPTEETRLAAGDILHLAVAAGSSARLSALIGR